MAQINDWDDTIPAPTEIDQLCNGVLAPTGYVARHGVSFLGFGVLVKIRAVSQI